MLYTLIRPFLFLLDAEYAHQLSLRLLKKFPRLLAKDSIDDAVEIMGIQFPNRVGLAAGLDKNADYFVELSALGFGFVEVGTVTPLPQPGNEKPRLFRLKEQQAIINRMGFNNLGVDHLLQQVKSRHFSGVLGINIGKNKQTDNDHAIDDYLTALEKIYEIADYVTINISSPNTPDLRALQFGEPLKKLLGKLKEKQLDLYGLHDRYVPLVVKIAPDITVDQLATLSNILVETKIDGVIATNTTVSREYVKDSKFAEEAGGLSGAPLTDRSNQVIASLRKQLPEKFPIIGVGGIMNAEDAVEKIRAGADLVQIYTGFIFYGPDLIHDSALAIKNYFAEQKIMAKK